MGLFKWWKKKVALKKAAEEEKKHLVTKDDLKEQDMEFKGTVQDLKREIK